MEETDSGAMIGSEGGGDGMAQLPGESMEDYIKRLKAAGLYGGEITDQPLVGGGPAVTGFGGVATPGSSSGLSVGSNMTSGGLSPGTGAGLSGKGMWEPDNSGDVGVRASPGGGGGSMPGGDHKTNALNVLLNNTTGNMAQSKPSPLGYVHSNFGNITPMASPTRRTNALYQYLQYVKPAYRGPTGGPIQLNGNPATNYLAQLMRGGR